jgi:hypothetical protein
MKAFKISILSISLLGIFFSSCSKEDKTLDYLLGEFNVAHLERYEVHWDGKVVQLADETDAGTFNFEVATSSAGSLLESLRDVTYDFTENGQTTSGDLTLKVDEEAKRIIIFGGACIQCDLSYNIEENSRNRQIWATHTPDNANKLTYVLRLTLERR